MQRYLHLLSALVLHACVHTGMPAPPGFAVSSEQSLDASQLVGCYRLLFGEWSGPESARPRTLDYVLPPGRIELAPGPHRYRGRADRMQPLLPGPGYDAPPEFAFSAWEPVGRDSVSLMWGHGMGGISMRLAVRGDTLQGRANAFTDVQGPEREPEAPAVALRVSCAPWRPGEVDMSVDAVLIRILRREPA